LTAITDDYAAVRAVYPDLSLTTTLVSETMDDPADPNDGVYPVAENGTEYDDYEDRFITTLNPLHRMMRHYGIRRDHDLIDWETGKLDLSPAQCFTMYERSHALYDADLAAGQGRLIQLLADTDGDGITDVTDNCPADANPLDPASIPAISADGDISLDNRVNAADALLAQRHVLGIATLTQEQIDHGDFTPAPGGDGALTLPDLLLTLQKVLRP